MTEDKIWDSPLPIPKMLSGNIKASLSLDFFKDILYEHFLLYLGLFRSSSLLLFIFGCVFSQSHRSTKTANRPHAHRQNWIWNAMVLLTCTVLCRNHKHISRFCCARTVKVYQEKKNMSSCIDFSQITSPWNYFSISLTLLLNWN